ncbi:MAG: acyl-CoA synthetase FdrA [Desulfobacteraceae bacterium]
MKKVVVQENSYFDSVFLMLTTKAIKQIPGVKEAVVSMGTDVNLEILKDIGLSTPELERATPNDMVIAIEGESQDVVEEAYQTANDMLRKRTREVGEEGEYRPVSFDTALKMAPDSNLAIISVPGMYAAREARRALENGLHVMLFSDNVSVEDEVELKKIATAKGLLMMGPDCGTAIINGKPLCFANVVREGDIGIVAASGSGLQEVSCRIDSLGGGISQAIGTGGRDLRYKQVGGMMMSMGIEALKMDPKTRVIVLISKPAAEVVAEKVLSKLKETGKPCVVHFIGVMRQEPSEHLNFVRNLEEAAGMAVALSRGEVCKGVLFSMSEETREEIVEKETAKMSKTQKYLRCLYTGGTLADESMFLFEREGVEIHSNVQTKPDRVLKDPETSKKHTIIDLGEDVFTRGRPHPMIDPSIREDRISKEMEDPEVAVFLLDFVLGYGSHEDPCGAMVEKLTQAKQRAEARGGYLSVIASITGTKGDFQNMEEQKKKLESIGCVVMPSNYQASMLALRVIKRLQTHRTE